MRAVADDLRARPCLEQDELERLIELGRDVERHYGRPQDLEWAIDRKLGGCSCSRRAPRPSGRRGVLRMSEGGPAARVAALYLDGGQLKL
jgi:Phosphoenolpyruvate synthase/pyruvate phosphate dikinase